MKRLLLFSYLFFGYLLSAQHLEVYNDTVCDTEEFAVIRTNIKSILTSAYVTDTIPYNFTMDFMSGENVTQEGTPMNIDDTYSDAVEIGFPFYFFGEAHDYLVIGSNGDIIFDPTISNEFDPWRIDYTDLIPSTELPYDFDEIGSIMGAYHDIDPSERTAETEIRYMLRGEAPNRQFVITYYEVPHFSSRCNRTHFTSQQIVLNESDYSIEVHVRHKPVCSSWNRGLATLGIQNNTKTCGYFPGDQTTPGASIANRNTSVWEVDSLVNPEAWVFRPDAHVEIKWYDADRNELPDQNADSLVVSLVNYNGPYTCEISYYDCEGNATVEYGEGDIIIMPAPQLDLGEDLKRCEDEVITLDATPLNIADYSDPGVLQYQWYKDDQLLDETSPVLEVNEPGLYRVEVAYGGCVSSDEILIENYLNSMCKIPNLITPNGDGKNDAFILDYLNDKKGISKIQIFNRWGQVVFEKENGYTDQWEGQNLKGQELPSASYYYVIELKDGTTETGWIHILK